MTKISALTNEPILQPNHVVPIYDPNEGLPANQNKSITLADMAIFFGAAPLLTGRLIYVDSVYGNDGTGAYESPAFPFLTIAAAQSIAVSGDRIVIRPGAYTDSNLSVDGVNYHFEDGAILTSPSNCFRDLGTNSFSVTGYGRFFSGQSVVLSTGVTNIYFEGIRAEGTGVGSRTIWAFGGGTIVVNIKTDLVLSGQEQVIRTNNSGSVYAMCERMIGAGGLIQAEGFEVICYAKEYIYNAAGNGYIGISCNTGRVEMLGGNYYSNAAGLYGLPSIVITATGSIKVHGDIISTCTDGTFSMSSSAYADFYGKINMLGDITINSGIVNFFNSITQNPGSLDVIIHNGGKTIVHSLVYNSNLGAGSRCINVNASGLILKQSASLWVNSILAESIYAAAAQNILSYPGAVANVATNVNITQLVSALLIDANVDNES